MANVRSIAATLGSVLFLMAGGAPAVSSKSPEDFKTYIDAETAKWAKVIEESRVRAD